MADVNDEKGTPQVRPAAPSGGADRPAPTEGGEKHQVADDESRSSADKDHPDSF